MAAELFSLIDAGEVKKTALGGGTDTGEQVEATYGAIERQPGE